MRRSGWRLGRWMMFAGLLLAAVGRGRAQDQESIGLEEVRSVLSTLSADDMMGRDTPSPGLEKAAAFLAKGLEEAGLSRLPGYETWFHGYELDGLKIPGADFEVTAKVGNQSVKLVPGRDLRIWTQGGPYKATETECVRMSIEDIAEKNLFPGRRSESPVFLEVDENSVLWRAAEGGRQQLGSRRPVAGAPFLLLRKGVLEPGALIATLELPAPVPTPIALKNVAAVLPGTEKPGEYVMLSAHYDHIGVNLPMGGDSVFNGADDDASGTTAVYTIARALARKGVKTKRSLLFVMFSGEEKGLRGSRAFADNPPVDLKSIVADINIEMIGRPMEGQRMKAWITGESYSDFAARMKAPLERAGVGLVEFGMAEQLFRQSDNFSLAARGVVAHSISAGSLHSDYHRPSDEIGKIDLEHMTSVIRAIRDAATSFADATDAPAWTESGRSRLGLDEKAQK